MAQTKKTIYIFGNPLLPFDSLPLKLVPKLRKTFPQINFKISDPNENLKPEKQEMVIVDTVMDIKKVTLIENIDKIKISKIYSLHDFDLGFNLKLLQKIGQLKKIKIFGIPPDIPRDKALEQLSKLLKAHT